MPIYEFLCEKCKKKFSVPRYYSGENKDIPVCPYCGAKNSHRIFSDVGIIFKGNGFYSTDNKDKSS